MPERTTVAALTERFGRERGVRFDLGKGGLVRAAIETPLCRGEAYLHGAHVTSYKPAGGDEVLFVSANSDFAPGRAIRGGVPICFPWFGPRAGGHAAHGFARTRVWQLAAVRREWDDALALVFELSADAATREAWPHGFRATYTATFGRSLGLALEVANVGADAFAFESALHAYFAVPDATRVALGGFEGATYLDKTRGGREDRTEGPVVFAGETDRVYAGHERAIAWNRTTVAKDGSRTTVVWNPAAQRAAELKLAEGEWRRFVCVEPANTGADAVTLAPGEKHVTHARVEVDA